MAEIIGREKSQAGARERSRERVSSEKRGVAEEGAEGREQMFKESCYRVLWCEMPCKSPFVEPSVKSPFISVLQLGFIAGEKLKVLGPYLPKNPAAFRGWE